MLNKKHAYIEGHGRPTFDELSALAGLIQIGGQTDESNTFIDQIDDQTLFHKLDYHGITLQALESGKLNTNVQKLIGSRKALMAANETLKAKAIIELFNAFEFANLDKIITFKGTALAYTVYNSPWLRPRSDCDCLIDRNDLEKFTQVFIRQGFDKEFAIEGKHVSYQQSFHKALAGQSSLNIDLHWRINNRQTLANTFSVEELISNGQTLDSLSESINAPCNVDSLLIASLHRLGHHQGDERLAWIRDIDLLARELSSEEWIELSEKASNKKLAAITLDALKTAELFFATPIDESVEDKLSTAAKNDEPSQLFLNRGLTEWQYFWGDIKGLPRLSNKLRLIMENTFPSPEYVRRQMDSKSALVAYAKRLFRGVKRILR